MRSAYRGQMDSARALLDEVVDYAGLFPPAAVPMAEAVAVYAEAIAGADAWMLGRFVLPAAQLESFAAARAEVASPRTWRLSAIVRDRAEDDRAAVAGFNAETRRHRALVDSIEARPITRDGIDWLADAYAGPYDVFVEVPAGEEAAVWLARIHARGLKAKVRTGGLTADAFPSPDALAAFLEAAVRLGVPFKATAGLHHAVRGSYRLTYAADADAAPMYGYLNVLLATAALGAGQPASTAEALLCETNAATLRFTADAVRWGTLAFPLAVLRETRAARLGSFGSCSFREPVEELHALTS
jgi:hypothetical protein